MNEHALVTSRRDHRYLVPSGSPLLMPRLIRENLSWRRKEIRHATFSNHCRSLAKIDWRHFDAPFREAATRLFAVLEARSDIFFGQSPTDRPVEAFIRMVEYRDYWIQPPEEWHTAPHKSTDQQWISLIKHLFVAYPIPDFFYTAWTQSGKLRSPARDWFCQIAAGKSIRKLKNLPTKLTGRAAHHAMSAPGDLTIEQALRHGQVIAFGGSEALAGEIVCSRAGTDFNRDAVWLKLIEKLAREPEFDEWEAGLVIDYLYNWMLENDGRSPEKLLDSNHAVELAARARLFWKETAERAAATLYSRGLMQFGLQSVRNDLLRLITRRWNPSENISPATIVGKSGAEWHISELCSELELQQEGSRMHHCVACYSHSCQRGTCSIWTVVAPDQSHVATIRIYPNDMELDEARAPFNDQPNREILGVIRTWAGANKIDDAWLTDEYDYNERPRLELIA